MSFGSSPFGRQAFGDPQPAAAGGGAFTLDTVVGSYTLTGASADIDVARKLSATPGSYALTGVSARLTLNRKLSTSPGTYTLTGASANLRAVRDLDTTPGSYSLTGQSSTQSLNRKLDTTAGSYSLTGSSANQSLNRKVSVTPGAYTITGFSAELTADQANNIITVTPGAYVITGFDADMRYSGRVVRRGVGFRKNYIIKGKRYTLSDYELSVLIQQMLNEVKRPEVQVVDQNEVKQISRKVWKRLKESLSNLEALSLERVEAVVDQNVIQMDDEDDEDLLLLL